MKKTLLILFLTSILVAQAQKPAYKIYNKNGEEVTYQEMIQTFDDTDVIFFGELHNNAIAHWLELELAKDLLEKSPLVLGAEMFEADDQLIMDEYLSGIIKHKHFQKEAKVWSNYETDYKPLVNFAKENKVPFIATNIPRRYANYVARAGIDSLKYLDKKAQQYMAKLPIKVDLELGCYKMFLNVGMGHGSQMTPEKMAQAQASKDATMAHFIHENMPKEGRFLHYNGAYHSANYESILHYLKQLNKKLRLSTITTVEADDISVCPEGEKGKADFIIVVASSMTKTY